MRKIKLGIAEDHEIIRNAIVKHINSERDMEVVLVAENGLHLLDLLRQEVTDVILMDIRMPVMNGIEATRNIVKMFPTTNIIAYSQYDIEENIIEMNIQGVKSFIGKEDDLEELLQAIRVVYAGGVYMTSKAFKIIQRFLKNTSLNTRQPMELTEIEIVLLEGICKGLSSTQLGEIIHKSPRTIEDYRTALYQKFEVRNKEQLITKAITMNLATLTSK